MNTWLESRGRHWDACVEDSQMHALPQVPLSIVSS